MDKQIWFLGDTHSRHTHIFRALKAETPCALIHVGDIQPKMPLEQEFKNLPASVPLYWIPGNHDCDSEVDFDNTHGSQWVNQCFDAKIIDVDGLKIAGLGGNFMGRIWHPSKPPIFHTRAEYFKSLPRQNYWREGLPLRVRSAIWWEDYEKLWDQRADILVTHEAPTSHRHGFEALDQLADAMQVKLVVHGHHHERYESSICDGRIKVMGVGLRGITALDSRVIVCGEQDVAREGRFKPEF